MKEHTVYLKTTNQITLWRIIKYKQDTENHTLFNNKTSTMIATGDNLKWWLFVQIVNIIRNFTHKFINNVKYEKVDAILSYWTKIMWIR